MRKVIGFVVKGIAKSKYMFPIPLVLAIFVVSLLLFNSNQSGNTHQELQETFDSRKEFVDFLIGKTLNKKRLVGLPEEQQLALESLLVQEEYLKEISIKVADGNLDIASDTIAYIKEYKEFKRFNFIEYQSEDLLEIEQKKAEVLSEHNLPYTEQETPYKTALFTKKLFQFLFNPITAFLFFLLFIYKYRTDEENRTFDFFRMNSLSNPAVYYGYLASFFIWTVGYILIASLFSLLPPLLTGNLSTVYYPIEVIVGSNTEMVPVWKWLLFLPIGWGLFVFLLLTIAAVFFKKKFPVGVLMVALIVPLAIAYIISNQFGFFMSNPIHLIMSYESSLLPAGKFAVYLIGMTGLLIACLGLSYPVFTSKGSARSISVISTVKKQYRPWVKGKLLQFEYLKKERKGHVFFTLLLVLGILVGNSVFTNHQYQTLNEKALKAIGDLQNFYIERQVDWKLLEEEFEIEMASNTSQHDSEDETSDFREENPYSSIVDEMERGIAVLDDLKKKAGEPHFLDIFRDMLKTLDSNVSYKELERSQWNVTVMASEEQENVLHEKGIKPWPIGDRWISNFDAPRMALDKEHYKVLQDAQERNTKYGNSGLFTVYKFFNWNMAWPIFGVFIFLVWTSLASEQGPQMPIRFLVTKPLRLRSIYISKWVYNLAIAYGLLLISGAIAFFLSSVIGGIGEPDYPMVVYANSEFEDAFSLTLPTSDEGAIEDISDGMFYASADNAYFYFESLLTMIFQGLLLIAAQIFFMNGVFSLIGRWMKNQYATIITVLLVTIVGYFIAVQFPGVPFMYLNPFMYFDTWSVVDGWKSIVASSSSVSASNGCLILLISGFLLFLAGLLPVRKKVS